MKPKRRKRQQGIDLVIDWDKACDDLKRHFNECADAMSEPIIAEMLKDMGVNPAELAADLRKDAADCDKQKKLAQNIRAMKKKP